MAPQHEGLRDGDRYQVSAVFVPEIINKATWQRVGTAELPLRSLAVVRNGRLVLEPSRGSTNETGPRGPLRTETDPYAVDDSILAWAVPLLGFTTASSPNPNYTAPIPLSQQYDTVTSVVDGQTLVGIYRFGDYGQPLSMKNLVDGELKLAVYNTWAATDGGYSLTRVRIEDWSQPDVLIRWTADITASRVVVLSMESSASMPLPWLARIATACLPQPLSATEVTRPPAPLLTAGVAAGECGWIAAKVLVGLLGVAGSGAGLVAAVYSGNVWGIRAAVASAAVSTFYAVDNARQFQKQCTGKK